MILVNEIIIDVYKEDTDDLIYNYVYIILSVEIYHVKDNNQVS